MTYFRDYERCVEAWLAQRAEEGYTPRRRMHFEGRTLYSYGSHFPLAHIFRAKGRDCVIVAVSRYSATTSKHQSITIRLARQTLGEHAVFCVSVEALRDMLRGDESSVQRYYERLFASTMALADKPRLWATTRERIKAKCRGIAYEANRYARMFGYVIFPECEVDALAIALAQQEAA